MERISREKIKVRGFRRFIKSWKYSWDGLSYAYQNEQSMLIHFIVSIFAIILGLYFGFTTTEWIIIGLTLSVVLVAELFNTAIEAVVDMVTLEIHPLAKIAKDCGSAATFICSSVGFLIYTAILLPYVIQIFGW